MTTTHLAHPHTRARLLVATCLAAFAALALVAALAEPSLLSLDLWLQQLTLAGRGSWLDPFMTTITAFGARQVIVPLAAALVLWSLATGRRRLLVAVIAVAVVLNPVVEFAFKELIGRARPDLSRLLPGNGPSFPSGHVLAAAGFYGVLPLLTRPGALRRIAGGVAALIVGVVAASRVYVGVHWATDALAGLLLGVVLVAITAGMHGRLRTRRQRRSPRLGGTGATPPCNVVYDLSVGVDGVRPSHEDAGLRSLRSQR